MSAHDGSQFLQCGIFKQLFLHDPVVLLRQKHLWDPLSALSPPLLTKRLF